MMAGRPFYKEMESNRIKSIDFNSVWDRSFVVNKYRPTCPMDYVLSVQE